MVAAEPQLLFALIVVFLMFLLFVRRKRAMLLLIPDPAAFAVAPTLVNAVRYADLGMWRQLFGDITVPTSSANGSPASLSLLEAAQRALGWRMGSTDYADLAVTVLFGVITLLALASLVLPFALRTSRLMWVVIVCGGALALVSSLSLIHILHRCCPPGRRVPDPCHDMRPWLANQKRCSLLASPKSPVAGVVP